MRATTESAILSVVCLCLLACTPDFDDAWLVKDLRILAMRADPPEVIAPSLADPLPPVSVDVLAVDPSHDPTRTMHWEAWVCSAEEQHCADAQFKQQLKAAETALSEVTLDGFVASPELLQACLDADPLHGFGGLPVMIEVRLDDGEHRVRAVKRLVYTFPLPYSPLPQGKQPNHNPSLDHVDFADAGQVVGDQTLSAATGQTLEIVPAASAGAAEDYVVTTNDGPGDDQHNAPGQQQLQEYLRYAYFATAGQLIRDVTGGRPDPYDAKANSDDVASTWIAPTDQHEATLWVVIRDDRGGTDWLRIDAHLR